MNSSVDRSAAKVEVALHQPNRLARRYLFIRASIISSHHNDCIDRQLWLKILWEIVMRTSVTIDM
ncbi:hypothetical protein [Chamaesiphon polymorphus]|nr:hypothetical protein [Chamaesiphon polymorphus]